MRPILRHPRPLRSRTGAVALLAAAAVLFSGCATGAEPADSPPAAVEQTASVQGIEPTSGSLVSGGIVTITGENLSDVTRVTFAGVGATDVTVVSDTQVTAAVPVAAEYVPTIEDVHVYADTVEVASAAPLTYERAVLTPVDAQLQYAFQHWSTDTYNLATYGEFNSVGGDCMNFVSQTLIARGIAQTSGWNFTSPTKYSGSWIYTPSFENYLLASPELGFTRLTVDQRDQVEVGDIVVFDWNDNDSADHIQIVSDIRVVDGVQQILMVGHNLDSNWRDFDTTITVDHPGALAWFWKVP
ncbi:hypothetical protein HD599_003054 [Conyzicola lurida]|uniref:IPT/TIG domain-containing protein n=2 Tax=Conyzicola lurida TaxID=1172621 RepID=A0A841ASG3_9MICO|nr:hypothetical protein [Conyzicola lurida]